LPVSLMIKPLGVWTTHGTFQRGTHEKITLIRQDKLVISFGSRDTLPCAVWLWASEKEWQPGKGPAAQHHSVDRIRRAGRLVSRRQAHCFYEQELRRRVRD